MRKLLPKIKTLGAAAVCLAFIISFICLYSKKGSVKAENESTVLNIWQIDSFEGGKGSRAEFLQSVGNDFGKTENCYVTVTALSSEAARLNLADGNVPDVISYGAGAYGLESYVEGYTVWCRGCYCLLTLDANSGFSDADSQNTVINKGKDNFATVASLFCNTWGGKAENSTAAYVKLINGDSKYLLGTQRDIFRLKTRKVNFSVKPITGFNDLYQNISITTKCRNKAYAQKFVDYLLSKRSEINKVGLFFDGTKLYEDEMSVCENIDFEYKITYPMSEATKNGIERAALNGDINMLKELLK